MALPGTILIEVALRKMIDLGNIEMQLARFWDMQTRMG